MSLDNSPHYEALSYVWGDTSICKPIVLDGAWCEITQNLFLALRRLRDPKIPRVIWIDAVCINQQNDDEKSAQVAMMGSIYSNFMRAILWLGEDSELVGSANTSVSLTAKKALELIGILGRGDHLNELPYFSITEKNTIYNNHWEKHGEQLTNRVSRISSILGSIKTPGDFGLLPCIGFYHSLEYFALGLVFEFPKPSSEL